jgi:hypothetical protein
MVLGSRANELAGARVVDSRVAMREHGGRLVARKFVVSNAARGVAGGPGVIGEIVERNLVRFRAPFERACDQQVDGADERSNKLVVGHISNQRMPKRVPVAGRVLSDDKLQRTGLIQHRAHARSCRRRSGREHAKPKAKADDRSTHENLAFGTVEPAQTLEQRGGQRIGRRHAVSIAFGRRARYGEDSLLHRQLVDAECVWSEHYGGLNAVGNVSYAVIHNFAPEDGTKPRASLVNERSGA